MVVDRQSNSGVPVGSRFNDRFVHQRDDGKRLPPAGSYSLSLSYTRVATGIKIGGRWFNHRCGEVLNSTTGMYQHNATSGVYSFSVARSTTPASSTWTYDELGFFLFGSSMTNSTVELNNVAFVPGRQLSSDGHRAATVCGSRPKKSPQNAVAADKSTG